MKSEAKKTAPAKKRARDPVPPGLTSESIDWRSEEGLHDRIFVQIASYRDPECQWTLKDMFEKATIPDRVFAGVAWQYVIGEDKHCFEIETRPEQVRIKRFNALYTKGVCWARSETQKLWEG